MGKLTDSLKATTKQLSELKHGINQMQELGRELADNTITVAEAALRTGYAYAKAEAEASAEQPEEALSRPQLSLSSVPNVLDAAQLSGATRWTQNLLKARFGNFQAAYQHLQGAHSIKLKNRSWRNLVDAFNGGVADRPLEQRVAELEQTVALQRQHITVMEEKLNEAILNLQQLMSIVEKLAGN